MPCNMQLARPEQHRQMIDLPLDMVIQGEGRMVGGLRSASCCMPLASQLSG